MHLNAIVLICSTIIRLMSIPGVDFAGALREIRNCLEILEQLEEFGTLAQVIPVPLNRD